MRLPQERMCRIFVNDKEIVTLMASPKDLRALVIGHIYHRGLIQKISDIRNLITCDHEENFYVTIDGTIDANLSMFVSSACGQPPILQKQNPPISSSFTATLDDCRKVMLTLLQKNQHEDRTGGIHAACLTDGQRVLYTEDIGRHNAQDKVVGLALEQGMNCSESILVTTGRISADMVAKAVYANLPIIGSLSIPTQLAHQLATEWGISLLARLAKESPNIFGDEKRIKK